MAAPRLLRHSARDWGWAALLTIGPVVLLYARTTFWHGDWCWGPRYLVFVVPVLFLPAVLWADHAVLQVGLGARVRQGLALVVLAAGLGVQLLGSAFYWDHFLRIDHEARPQWLGRPNRAGASTPDRGGWCDPCVEDLYGVNWLPAFSPLEGHLWLARHVPFRHNAQQALVDAPWRRYTSLTLDIGRSYPRTRVDWWILDYGKTQAPGRRADHDRHVARAGGGDHLDDLAPPAGHLPRPDGHRKRAAAASRHELAGTERSEGTRLPLAPVCCARSGATH